VVGSCDTPCIVLNTSAIGHVREAYRRGVVVATALASAGAVVAIGVGRRSVDRDYGTS
jgi:hypothetical protein